MTLLINKPKTAKVLFIKGVFKKDCVSDDIFEKRILERIDNTIDQPTQLNGESSGIYINNFISYEKLPSIFEDINTWQKQTNLLCWNCSLSFTSIPVFIPQVIEPCLHKHNDTIKYSISVHGVFCSFICAKHYVKTRYHTIVDRTETLNKLELLYKLFYNIKMKDVTNYPLPQQMKQYGGDLSIEEFTALLENSKKEEASYAA
jgi:hypothetical protein